MKPIIRLILTLQGGLMLGILLHEAYHTQTIKHVTQICYETNTDALFAVYGFGGSVDEVRAYLLTGVVVALTVVFAVYDLLTSKD